jgi:hypothetical protein
MDMDYTRTDFEPSDDLPLGKTNEERACERVLLVMCGAGLAVFALYTLATFCGMIAPAG